ncbi:MAG: response regulator transcription factor [Actinomycetales bacterium]|nr:response regulator transcription factor [Actinomycetales bacterium]
MLLGSQPDLEVVGEAGDGAEAVAVAERERPDLILMDLRMPRMDGVEATRRILAEADAAARPAPRVIALTTFDFDEAARRALDAGASGFLLKDADPEFLLAAVRQVHAGSAVIAPSATRELLERFGRAEASDAGDSAAAAATEPRGFAALTEREREIFLLAARGLSNAEIARQEFVSEATVKTHVSRILAKLELRDRVQLVVYAFENRLV